MRQFLHYYLQTHYRVVAMNNGHDALVYLQKGNTADLIISDLDMPEMNGNKLLEHIKSSSFFRDIPFMVLSGKQGSTERIKCLELGAIDFVMKPFNPEELKVKVYNIFKGLKMAG